MLCVKVGIMDRTVNIIGAGIAGLSAGCYLQMNGYRTRIFELHNLPGGLCTAWKRNGYTFDGCIDWLVGSGPSNSFYHIWNELIDMSKLEFVEHEVCMRIEDKEGKTLTVFSDIDKLENEMLRVAPEDERVIRKFTKAVRRLAGFNMPIDKAPETFNLWDKLLFLAKLIPYAKELKYWMSITAGEYAAKCKNPLLAMAFGSMFMPQLAAIGIVFKRVWANQKSAGYPIGGSLNFSRKIEDKYLSLGGEIHYGSRVAKVIVENDKAIGIQLSDGEVHNADITISAADGYNTIYEMLEGKYINNEIDGLYKTGVTFPSWIQLSLGIARRFDDVPHIVMFPLEKPIVIDETTSREYLRARIYNYDPTLAPEGKTVMTFIFPTDNYSYWQRLRDEDRDQYKSQKNRIACEVIEALDVRFGDVSDNVEEVDVSTPSTVIRYTNNWKGSLEGWILTPEIGYHKPPKQLPGLEDFYMTGQWVEPGGGLPSAVLSGRNVTQIICKKDRIRFTPTKSPGNC